MGVAACPAARHLANQTLAPEVRAAAVTDDAAEAEDIPGEGGRDAGNGLARAQAIAVVGVAGERAPTLADAGEAVELIPGVAGRCPAAGIRDGPQLVDDIVVVSEPADPVSSVGNWS
jgi:hypothetical protein